MKSLSVEWRKLRDNQDDILRIVSGEDAQIAKDMQFWSVAQFYASQAAQQRILTERIKERERVAAGAKK